MSTNNFVKKYHVLNVFDVHKLQSLLLMYDVCNNTAYLPFVNFVTNNVIHSHNTRSNINLHIEQVSSIDKRNFIYHCMLYWNACPIHVIEHYLSINLFNSVKLHKLAAYNIFQCYYYLFFCIL